MSIKILIIEIRRKILNIFSPQFASIFYTNTDGQALPFVPNNGTKNTASFSAVGCFTIHAFSQLKHLFVAESKTGVVSTPVLLNLIGMKIEALFLVQLAICRTRCGPSASTRRYNHLT